MDDNRYLRRATALSLFAVLLAGCASVRGPYTTRRDKAVRGAAIGAAVGAAAAIATGKREADEILAGAGLGAVAGGAVGAYMDAQEEKLARIPNTTVERVDEETLLVRFDSDILFAFDSSALRADSLRTVDQVAEVLAQYDKTAVVVQGHTDAQGTDEYNQALSQRRATSVERHLQERGIDGQRISTQGLGEGYPVASNADEAGRQLNRRVEVMVRARA